MAAPVASVTAPEMVPPTTWALALRAGKRANRPAMKMAMRDEVERVLRFMRFS
jgi:hypothetical protein